MTKKASPSSMHSVRKARIYPLRSEILRRIADGQSVGFIRSALGFDDVPRSSFYENVRKLRLMHPAPRASAPAPVPAAFPREGAGDAPAAKRVAPPGAGAGDGPAPASRPRRKALRIGAMNAENLPPTKSNPENWGV